MIYCPKCGCKQDRNAITLSSISQCYNCKIYINPDGSITRQTCEPPGSKVPDSQDVISDNPKKYIIIWAIGLALTPLILISYIASLVTMVIAFIKCPNSMAIKILFWITIGVTVLFLVAAVTFIVVSMACGMVVDGCTGCVRACPNQ